MPCKNCCTLINCGFSAKVRGNRFTLFLTGLRAKVGNSALDLVGDHLRPGGDFWAGQLSPATICSGPPLHGTAGHPQFSPYLIES